MRLMGKSCVTMIMLVVLPLISKAQTHPDSIRYNIARQVAVNLGEDDYVAIHDHFSPELKKELSSQKIALVWYQLMYQYGKYNGVTEIYSRQKNMYNQVVQTLQVGEERLDLNLTFNSNNEIVGIYIVPEDLGKDYELPDYADTTAYTEQKIIINGGGSDLPGILTLPKGVKKPQLVILVHGSGPNDMDESLGSMKLFKDIAAGLATKGVATYRYDKRTKVAPQSFGEDFTVEEEVIADAVAAYNVMRKQKTVDRKNIYVLGHSLGGMLAPRIAGRTKNLKGIILMAAPARQLQDILVEQFEYIYGLDDLTEEEEREITIVKRQVKTVNDRDFDAETGSSEMPLGLPATYWLDLQDYDQIKTAQELKIKRLLIAQGGRDYQVTMEDFELWKTGLIGKQDVTFLAYPDLNHAFVEGEGKAVPSEYMEEGNVAEKFIIDVAEWVKD